MGSALACRGMVTSWKMEATRAMDEGRGRRRVGLVSAVDCS